MKRVVLLGLLLAGCVDSTPVEMTPMGRVCNTFCVRAGATSWSISSQHVYNSSSRYWCTCNNGEQKEVF